MRDYQFTVPAGSEGGITARGSFVRIKEASGPVRLRAVDAKGETVADLEVSAGVRFQLPVMFVQLRIENQGSAQVTVVLTAGDGSADDSSVTGSLSIDKSQIITTAADVSVAATATAIIAAANTLRREILITNLSSNTAAFRIGDSNAGAARGAEVLPGSTITLTTAAAVYAYNPSAGAESLAVVEVLD